MEHYKKSFIEKEFVIPAIAAVVGVALTIIVLVCLAGRLPFFNESIRLAGFNSQQITEAEKFTANGIVKKSELPELKPNTSIGSIQIDEDIMPLIYEPCYENSGDCLALYGDVLIGEAGSARISCLKQSADGIRSLKAGDEISVSTFYGDYSYTVERTFVTDDVRMLSHSADDLGRGIIIYTDKRDSLGISDGYFVTCCSMTSDTGIKE